MKILLFLSDFIIPLLIFYIVAYGLISKVNIYDEFVKGAQDGFKTVLKVIPTLVGLMMAVGILRASGALELLSKAMDPLGDILKIPLEIVPVFFIKMFSSSAANGLVLDIFKEYGPDSLLGRMTSIMMSCTETIFYTLSVYFIAANVTKTRYTLKGALIASTAGGIASIVITYWVF